MTAKSSTGEFRKAYELTRCIVCGGSDTTDVAGPDDLREEAELLWAFHMRRLSPRTPPERLVDRVAFSQDRPWRVVQCDACGFVFRNPVEKRAELRDAYTAEPPPHETLMALHAAQRPAYSAQARRLRSLLRRRGRGLEVGSYVGAFLSAARDARWNFEGLDVNKGVNCFTRSLGFTVHDGDLERFKSERRYDAVAIWNTFDQLPDPRAAVRAAARLLRPGGVLAIRVPNGASYARWRSRLAGSAASRRIAATVMAHNNLLTFPYRFGFTPGSLTKLLEDSELHVERVVSDSLVPTADEWTRYWARVEERVLRPLTRVSQPWFEVYARR
jgi:SAM-dependent methyltransferase